MPLRSLDGFSVTNFSLVSICFLNVLLRDGSLRACLFFCFWFVFECITSTINSQRSSAGISCIRKPASRETISDSVELCDTHLCFLHNQLFGTYVWLPNAQYSTWSRFRVLKISSKVRVLKVSQSALFSSITHMTILFFSHVWWIYEINRFGGFSFNQVNWHDLPQSQSLETVPMWLLLCSFCVECTWRKYSRYWTEPTKL